jgi:hypothetical protein
MDTLDQVLGMLASLAGVFGFVLAYVQHRVKHQRAADAPPPPPSSAPWQSRPAHLAGGPPAVVRVAAVWVVAEATITVLLLYAVFQAVADDVHSFGFTVPDLPESVFVLAPVGLAALIGVVSVPIAIQRAGGLRDGDSAVRGKLLGSAAKDLFLGVALAVGAQVFADDLPESVFGVLTLYLTYRIVTAFVHLALLLHTGTRAWVEVNRANRAHAGRAR